MLAPSQHAGYPRPSYGIRYFWPHAGDRLDKRLGPPLNFTDSFEIVPGDCGRFMRHQFLESPNEAVEFFL